MPGLEVSPRTSKRNSVLRKQYKDIAFSLVTFFFLMMKTTMQAVWEKGQRSLCSFSGPLQVFRSHSFHPRCYTLPSGLGPAAMRAAAFTLKCNHSGRKVWNEGRTHWSLGTLLLVLSERDHWAHHSAVLRPADLVHLTGRVGVIRGFCVPFWYDCWQWPFQRFTGYFSTVNFCSCLLHLFADFFCINLRELFIY